VVKVWILVFMVQILFDCFFFLVLACKKSEKAAKKDQTTENKTTGQCARSHKKWRFLLRIFPIFKA